MKTLSHKKISSVAISCDRTGISDWLAAIVASSTLHDAFIIERGESSAIIDRNKVRIARLRERRKMDNEYNTNTFLESIYFDGRKNNALYQENRIIKCTKKVF